MGNRKRVIAVTLLITIMLVVAMSALCGCVNHEEEVVIGDFVCQIWKSNGTINLKDLSEEGKKKKYIVVPQEINGMKVNMLGYRNAVFSPGRSDWHSENLEKIFILGTRYQVMRGIFNNCCSLSKILFVNCDFENSSYFSGDEYILFINSRNFFSGNIIYDQEKPSSYAANVSYYYNYEDAPNAGYYWLDDVEDGELIEYVPEEPTREGYRFEGWYKESECVNRWDFENDRVIKAQIHLEGVEKFIENKLFAKWAEE